jgi:hypothetical protein
MKPSKKRKCGSCGGYCGGRRGSCKFAANEAKRRADEIWQHATGKSPSQEADDSQKGGGDAAN